MVEGDILVVLNVHFSTREGPLFILTVQLIHRMIHTRVNLKVKKVELTAKLSP